MPKIKEDNRAKDQASAQLSSIVEMVRRLEHAQKCKNKNCKEFGDIYIVDKKDLSPKEARHRKIELYHDEEDARETIEQNALEICVRSDWHHPGDEDFSKPSEYIILCCTGGPAVRIIGELNEHQEPDNASLEYQDWGTPWTNFPLTQNEEAAILTYTKCFYFGE